MSNEKKAFHYPKTEENPEPAKAKDKTGKFFKYPVDATEPEPVAEEEKILTAENAEGAENNNS